MAIDIKIVIKERNNQIAADILGRPDGYVTPAEMKYANDVAGLLSRWMAENSDEMKVYEADMDKVFKRDGHSIN
ncbi:hypothetical protein CFL29_004027 [Salmonella enterica]|nr:hypothetical protein [Salmonella enterica]EHR0543622.1 hypothetical protein [Salmonella enterica]EIB5040674.1 hypothetical protein [Salmonella enterica]EIL4580634.1 hypothetical protein [Salmonella enterica]